MDEKILQQGAYFVVQLDHWLHSSKNIKSIGFDNYFCMHFDACHLFIVNDNEEA